MNQRQSFHFFWQQTFRLRGMWGGGLVDGEGPCSLDVRGEGARLLAPIGSWSVIWKLCWWRDDEVWRVDLGMGEGEILGITTCGEDVGWTGC